MDRGSRWQFEACFFDKAFQSEPNSDQNRVNLGAWRGFIEDYTLAVFDGGDPCANVGGGWGGVWRGPCKRVCGDMGFPVGLKAPSRP